jgi:putative ABC transport system permease protein
MRKMIMLVIFFAILLGVIIIYNMGILSYSEKQYQFATLKVLGFTDKKIKHVFIEQNIWITIVSIMIGFPSGYFLTSWLFKVCLDEAFDFSVHINASTYILASIMTFIVSYLVSRYLARRVKSIDMVSSLKGNE